MDNINPPRILTINAGSSSIKLAVFESGDNPRRLATATVENIGQDSARLVTTAGTADSSAQVVEAPDHAVAASVLIGWLRPAMPDVVLAAIGHRIVHGGPNYHQSQIINEQLLADLTQLIPFDPEHLAIEIDLIKTFQKIFPDVPQVACFDTAFHHDLPISAQRLAIPHRYATRGIRRYGFHGLSYAYLLYALQQQDVTAATQRVILAHLGNGVSLAAVQQGKSIDTTMGFTPASGLPMGTRSGDLDPGLMVYLAREEHQSPDEFNTMVNFKSGLLGLSETTGDMKELLEHEAEDPLAKEAIDLFCYQLKKSIGSLSAALGGVDTIIFSGGMGENAPKVRARACQGLEFLGIQIDETRNNANQPVISSDQSPVKVRVIPTDEAYMIAREVWGLLPRPVVTDATQN